MPNRPGLSPPSGALYEAGGFEPWARACWMKQAIRSRVPWITSTGDDTREISVSVSSLPRSRRKRKEGRNG